MAWKITLDEKSILIDDLPISDVSTLCRKYDISWLRFLHFPASHLEAFCELVGYIANRLDVDAPKMDTVKDMERVLELLEEVDDDLPTLFVDGAPKAEAGPKTAGNSGQSAKG